MNFLDSNEQKELKNLLKSHFEAVNTRYRHATLDNSGLGMIWEEMPSDLSPNEFVEILLSKLLRSYNQKDLALIKFLKYIEEDVIANKELIRHIVAKWEGLSSEEKQRVIGLDNNLSQFKKLIILALSVSVLSLILSVVVGARVLWLSNMADDLQPTNTALLLSATVTSIPSLEANKTPEVSFTVSPTSTPQIQTGKPRHSDTTPTATSLSFESCLRFSTAVTTTLTFYYDFHLTKMFYKPVLSPGDALDILYYETAIKNNYQPFVKHKEIGGWVKVEDLRQKVESELIICSKE